MFFCLISLPKHEATGAACCCGWEKPPHLVRQGEQSRNETAFAVLASSCCSHLPHAGCAMPARHPLAAVPLAHTMAGARRMPQPPGPQCGPQSVAGVRQHGRSSPGPPATPQAIHPIAGGGRHRLPWGPGCPLGKRLVAKWEFAPHTTIKVGARVGGGAGASPGLAQPGRRMVALPQRQRGSELSPRHQKHPSPQASALPGPRATQRPSNRAI